MTALAAFPVPWATRNLGLSGLKAFEIIDANGEPILSLIAGEADGHELELLRLIVNAVNEKHGAQP